MLFFTIFRLFHNTLLLDIYPMLFLAILGNSTLNYYKLFYLGIFNYVIVI